MRYAPTKEEIEALEAKGWECDMDGWWYIYGEWVEAKTYKEAVAEQARRERRAKRERTK